MPVLNAPHPSSRVGGRPIVQVHALGKTFEHDQSLRRMLRRLPPTTTTAVQDLTLEIAEGEVFGLVGPNGAGKTTLLRLLSTLLVPSAGSASVVGFDVVRDAPAVRKRVGLVTSNERSFFWRLTGRQNLRFFCDLYHLPHRETSQWVDELLDLLDLRQVAEQRFEGYSTGVKQRFAIARGLLHRPQVLFMDEPTKGVDPKSAADIIALIRDRVVNQAKQTVIITTHNLREIEQLCQRTLIMERGRMAYLGTTDGLKRMVVGHNAYRIELAQVPPGLVERLAPLCAAPVGQTGSGVLDLQLAASSQSLDEVMRLIVEARCGLVSCQRIEIPIEDAFVAFLLNRKVSLPQEGDPAVPDRRSAAATAHPGQSRQQGHPQEQEQPC